MNVSLPVVESRTACENGGGARSVRRVGIFGHVGVGNLGDEAIIAAVIDNVKRRYPTAEVYGFSINPHDTQRRHSIPAFPIRRMAAPLHGFLHRSETNGDPPRSQKQQSLCGRIALRVKANPLVYTVLKSLKEGVRSFWECLQEVLFLVRSFHRLKGLDLLIIAGSNQLLDNFGGPWGFPYTLLKWSLLVRARGARLVFLSIGAGPIRSALSRVFIKWALGLGHYRSYRDEGSKRLLEEIRLVRQDRVSPDLVFSLRTPDVPVHSSRSRPSRIVGINPMPWCDPRYWPEPREDLYGRYIETLASFATWLLHKGYAVLFFPTQLRADPPVIRDVVRLVESQGILNAPERIINQPVMTFDDLLSTIALTDMVVATRFHGILISCMMHKPVLGIAYQKKSRELLTGLGQSEYVCDITNVDLESLQERFVSLEAHEEKIRYGLREKVVEYRELLDRQYDDILRV